MEEQYTGKGDGLQADSDKIDRGSTPALTHSSGLVSPGGTELMQWLYTTKMLI